VLFLGGWEQEVQGYLFSPPVPVDRARALLEANRAAARPDDLGSADRYPAGVDSFSGRQLGFWKVISSSGGWSQRLKPIFRGWGSGCSWPAEFTRREKLDQPWLNLGSACAGGGFWASVLQGPIAGSPRSSTLRLYRTHSGIQAPGTTAL
jgi:hypothetical protein